MLGLAIVFPVTATTWPALADGSAGPCERARVESVGELAPGWADELQRICRTMPALPDVDPTARVRVLAGAPVVVTVTLGDGRTASREVSEISALGPTVDALVTVPPSGTASAPPPPATGPVAAPALPLPTPTLVPLPPLTPLSDLSIELGGLFMGRLQGGPLYIGLGPVVWASLNHADWLFGVGARIDAFVAQPTGDLPSFSMVGGGAGFEVARRFRVHALAGIDAGVGAQVLQELQSTGSSDGQQSGQHDEDDITGAATDMRLLALMRVHAGGRFVRFTADLEAELSPLRVGREVRIEPALPMLPSFGLGLGAGVSWQGP